MATAAVSIGFNARLAEALPPTPVAAATAQHRKGRTGAGTAPTPETPAVRIGDSAPEKGGQVGAGGAVETSGDRLRECVLDGRWRGQCRVDASSKTGNKTVWTEHN
ncbi:hypothetical protein AAFF_G00024360 [Aldrovandia affinis]|uniref:Uncharacterized protein n=1 Tax=Aldrovandia affinis TaxID=143900 RepID=A0AAD7WZR4_9TELE|nr:hypothetical protein AAFF_G00024360 [Aldrovandia affinis]